MLPVSEGSDLCLVSDSVLGGSGQLSRRALSQRLSAKAGVHTAQLKSLALPRFACQTLSTQAIFFDSRSLRVSTRIYVFRAMCASGTVTVNIKRHQKSLREVCSVNWRCTDSVEWAFRACLRNINVGKPPSTIDSVEIRTSQDDFEVQAS